MDSIVQELQVRLADLAARENEQTERIKIRTVLLTITFTVMGALGAGALTADAPLVLLLIAPAGAILGWNRLSVDHKVTQIGDYKRDVLGPLIEDLLAKLGQAPSERPRPALPWERGRDDARRMQRKRLQLAADLGLYLVVPTLAGVIAVTLRPSWWAAVLLVAGEAMVALVSLQMYVYAGVRGSGRG